MDRLSLICFSGFLPAFSASEEWAQLCSRDLGQALLVLLDLVLALSGLPGAVAPEDLEAALFGERPFSLYGLRRRSVWRRLGQYWDLRNCLRSKRQMTKRHMGHGRSCHCIAITATINSWPFQSSPIQANQSGAEKLDHNTRSNFCNDLRIVRLVAVPGTERPEA